MRRRPPHPLRTPAAGRHRAPAALCLALAGLLGAAGCGGDPGTPADPAAPASAAPSSAGSSATAAAPGALAGERLFLDPEGDVAVLLREARAAGRDADAAVLEALLQPTATWFAGQHEDPRATAERISLAAAADGSTPVLVVYEVPGRDCGLYSDGGAADADAYLDRVQRIAEGLADRPAVVVLEPDAVPQALTGCEGLADPAARYDLLGRAVDVLAAGGGTRVYLDAGNSAWAQDLGGLAEALTASGVERADGFALNTSNFRTTEESAAYGQRLGERLGGARFVVDTSRNGAGPLPEDGSGLTWCNPPERRTGKAPTTDPGLEGVDALLWVKQPGDSDGDCRPGEPAAGEFWMEQAAELVR